MTTQTALCERTENAATGCESTHDGRQFRPNVDILEQPDELTIVADLPGARREDVDVTFENGILTIRGRVPARQPANTDYLRAEYCVGDYRREFRVSNGVDAQGIRAEFRDGVLTVHLAKLPAVRTRRVPVEVDAN